MFELIKENIKKAEVTDDCCGKWDLDFPVLYISTRGWPDNTAKCSFMLASDDEDAGDWEDILVSDYIEGDSREDCIQKCRKWYIDNLHVVMNSFVAEAESVNEDKIAAFDIIKEKGINLYMLKICDSLEEYNKLRNTAEELDQHEYDLLRRTLL